MLQSATTHKPRLLLLDEDRIILQSLSQFLAREGYEVRSTPSPQEAMESLEAQQADLLIADVNMPGVSPAEFLRECRRRFPHVVVIVITGYASIERAVEAVKLGVFDYLTKPIIDDEIRVVVQKAARQQALLSENHNLKRQLDLRLLEHLGKPGPNTLGDSLRTFDWKNRKSGKSREPLSAAPRTVKKRAASESSKRAAGAKKAPSKSAKSKRKGKAPMDDAAE